MPCRHNERQKSDQITAIQAFLVLCVYCVNIPVKTGNASFKIGLNLRAILENLLPGRLQMFLGQA